MRDRLMADVEALSGAIGRRNVMTLTQLDEDEGLEVISSTVTLDATADWIEERLDECGAPSGRHRFTDSQEREFTNIICEFRGSTRANELLVIGAHYDSVFTSPGADDNATGVAALLELVRDRQDRRSQRTIQFVFFANEEQPYFRTEEMGSYIYAGDLWQNEAEVVGMISLDMLGYFDTAPESQMFPSFITEKYPPTGDYIVFVGSSGSRGFLIKALNAFRTSVDMPSEGVILPFWVEPSNDSDNWSFNEHGYDAFFITDTGPYRNPHYHLPTDLADTLDPHRFALVVTGLKAMVEALANPGELPREPVRFDRGRRRIGR